MKEQILAWRDKIDARELRERVLILFSFLAVVYLLLNLLIQAPLDKKRAQLNLQLAALTQEREAVAAQITSVSLAAANNPAVLKQQEIKNLQASIAEVDAQLQNLAEGLISAAQLPQALESILAKAKRLKVQSISTLPAVELQLPGVAPANAGGSVNPNADSSANLAEDTGTGVYKHGVILKLQGSYFELMDLLLQIEASPLKFYWESLDFRTLEYPRAEIELKVFTLSSEEGLLGV